MKNIIFLFSLSFCFADIKEINNFVADFNQTITNDLKQNIMYSGKVYIQKPSNALWQYLEPIKKDVYLNDKKVYIVENDLEQVTITTLSDNINFIELIEKAKKISTNTYKTKLNNIDAIITTSENKIKSIEYTDNMANNVKIIFSNQEQNKILDESIFKINIPSGYDIIN